MHKKNQNKKVTFCWSLASAEPTGVIGARGAINRFGPLTHPLTNG